MKNILFRLATALIFPVLLTGCEQDDHRPSSAGELQAQATGLIKNRTRKLPFEAPVAWAAVENGNTVASFKQGREIPGGPDPVSDHSLFLLASASKLFTSVMVMKAVEEGKLKLSAGISDYVPSLPAAWHTITVAHLLSHTDGIAGVWDNSRYKALPRQTAEHLERDQYIAYAAELPLHFEPGTETRYGQSGYVLLSLALEKVYGRPYEDIVKTKILAPAAMTETHFFTESDLIGSYKPQLFEPQGDGFNSVTPGYVYADYATAGMCSSLSDMIRFMKALQNHQLLSEQNFRRLFTPVKGASGFALGWEYRYKDGRLMAGHSGGWSVVIMHLPESNRTSIFLSNAAAESILDTGYQVAELCSSL